MRCLQRLIDATRVGDIHIVDDSYRNNQFY